MRSHERRQEQPGLLRCRTTAQPREADGGIVLFVLKHRERIDSLIAKVRDAIERLEELRTALISAAVTGKIDVREEAA